MIHTVYALELAIQNEFDMRDMYLELARKFRDDRFLYEMWSHMSDAESGHAAILIGLRKQFEAGILHSEIDVNVELLEMFRVRVHDFRTRLAEDELSKDEIFSTVLDLEDGEQEEALGELLQKLPPPLSEKIIAKLEGPVSGHLKILLDSITATSRDSALLKRAKGLRTGW